jgi:hypothetical protein
MRENIRAAEETAQTSKTEAEEAKKNEEKALRKAEEETTKRLELEEELRHLRAQFGVPARA